MEEGKAVLAIFWCYFYPHASLFTSFVFLPLFGFTYNSCQSRRDTRDNTPRQGYKAYTTYLDVHIYLSTARLECPEYEGDGIGIGCTAGRCIGPSPVLRKASAVKQARRSDNHVFPAVLLLRDEGEPGICPATSGPADSLSLGCESEEDWSALVYHRLTDTDCALLTEVFLPCSSFRFFPFSLSLLVVLAILISFSLS